MNFKEHLKRYLSESEINNLISSLTNERTHFLILNTNKMNKEQFKKEFPNIKEFALIDNAFSYDDNEYHFGKNYYFDNGVYYIMDSASMLVSNSLDYIDGENVLDMCAAPGGKSIIACLKNKNINLLSNDLSYQRALVLSSNIEKMGFGNVTITSTDLSRHIGQFNKTFDHIILDAPCSGSAMFRKLEEMEKDWTYEKVLKCQNTQRILIENAYLMLKEGGSMVYSTCSFSYEEDEEIILEFLKNHDDVHIVKLEDNPQFFHSKELPEAIHLFPSLFNGEGQFFCVLKKDGISLKEEKYKGFTRDFEKIEDSYDLNFASDELINNTNLYCFNNRFNLKGISTLRNGLFVGEINKNIFKPSFHLAHYLSSNNSIILNDEERKMYLHGDTFNKLINKPNGFYVVSYNNINLGFVKNINNTLKNFYPKGLRH